jgi:hypothetical protein
VGIETPANPVVGPENIADAMKDEIMATKQRIKQLQDGIDALMASAVECKQIIKQALKP